MVKGSEIKKQVKNVVNFLKQKKVINLIIIIAFLAILISSSWIRLQNLQLLKDTTNGEYIPLALDPHYFLRLAETYLSQGELSGFDEMRIPGFNVPWHTEKLPQAIVGLYKVASVFDNSVTIQFIGVISTVIFFAIGLVIFFFLVLYTTKSKFSAIIATVLLAFLPSYLYRTMAGFVDHEAIGMISFFGILLFLSYSLNIFEKKYSKAVFGGVMLGLLTLAQILTWAGAIKFLILIISIAFLIIWAFTEKENKLKGIVYYSCWIISTIIFSIIVGGGLKESIMMFAQSTSISSLFVLAFILIDYGLLKKYSEKIKLSRKYVALIVSFIAGIIPAGIFYFFYKEKFGQDNWTKKIDVRFLLSFLITVVLGGIGLFLIGENVFALLGEIIYRLIFPFGTDRLGLTVAENAQPYLNDWISQTGKSLYYLFLLGLFFVGLEFMKSLKKIKYKVMGILSWIIFIMGILYSRISAESVLNGTNTISRLFYIGSLLIFIGYMVWLYLNEELKIDKSSAFLFSWMFVMLISARSAARTFFVLTPFVCYIAGDLPRRIWYFIKITKEEVLSLLLKGLFVIVVILLLTIASGAYSSVKEQAKYTGPSANVQWQEAMQWVRENTTEDSLFSHWWDYGYWVQSLGERATISDGGQAQSRYTGNHKIGRYILTTPLPETAMSLWKTFGVDYLLIDPTELTKYPAYSKIGSDNYWDRFSIIPTLVVNQKQTVENSNGTIFIYNGQAGVDEDIKYVLENGLEVFLPGPTYDEIGNPNYKSFLIGAIMEISSKSKLKQPEAVFVYNNNQIRLPLRYVYINEELIDFGTGLEATLRIVPLFDESKLDQIGSAIYLSPKVTSSLFAQLYLMNDPFNNYETIKLAHSELDPVVKSLNSAGISVKEFVFYNGLRGPIKIWDVSNIPEEINILPEWKERLSGTNWGELDNLIFKN